MLKRVRKFILRTRYHTLATVSQPRFLKFSLVVITLTLVGVSGTAWYSYNLYQQSQAQMKKLQSATTPANNETQQVIDMVAKHMVLPKDETPTIGTVTDNTKLQKQPFFAKATNGDKVLIYAKNKKAILYSPTQKKVVEVAPLNMNKKEEVAGAATQVIPTTAPVQSQKIRVVSPTIIPTQ